MSAPGTRFRRAAPGNREAMLRLDTIADKARGASDRLAGSGGLKGKLADGSSPKSGPSPFLVVGVAFATGIVLAKWIDWRGHAHPRK
jgi:hypothetical protein